MASLSTLLRRATLSPRPILVLLKLWRTHRLHGPVALLLVLLLSLCGAIGLNIDVGDAAAGLSVLGEDVVGLQLGVLGDDVPGVEEAWDETEHAEEDVDEGVGGAEAGLDPD